MSRLNSFVSGVRLLDLGHYYPGPLASLLLADLGMEVTKVEPPAGDGMQDLGPRDGQGRPVYYHAVNAGKNCIRIDLKTPYGVREFKDLVQASDILIEGFRPGVMKRLGLGYEELKKENPRLIYCSLSGYGAGSPLAGAAGHDGNYLSIAGVLHRNGDNRPFYFDPPVSDASGALFAVIAILGALNARNRDGVGCEIDIALADTVMPLQLFQLAEFGALGVVPARRSSYLNGGAACYQVYGTSDDAHVMLGAAEMKFWRAFCVAAGRPDWVARYDEPAPQDELRTEVAAFFATMTREEIISRFAGVDCCLTPVLDLREALASPHHMDRGLVRESPEGALQALFPAIVDGEAPASRPQRHTAQAASSVRREA